MGLGINGLAGIGQKTKECFLILCWSLYDLANQFFAVNVVSLYFVRWLTLEIGAPEIFYSVTFGISTFLVALSAPFLGVVSDATSKKRPFLVFFTLLSIFFTIGIGFCKNILLALLFFAVANLGCQLATVFYNAQLADIAPRQKLGFVSGLGRMLGYSGAILALYFVKPVVLKSGYQAAFLPTGILFFVFALPCMLFIKDKKPSLMLDNFSFLKRENIRMAFNNLKSIIYDAHKFPGLPDFLKASFFSLCAINAVILFMSVYVTKVFGLTESQVVSLIAFSTIFAILGSVCSGFLSDYLGARNVLAAAFMLWGVCLFSGALVRDSSFYRIIGMLVGLALGATWVVARAMVVTLVPKEKLSQAFGIFNFLAYFAAITGSLFWGVIVFFLSSLGEAGYRFALLSLNLFIIFGLIFILRLPKKINTDDPR